MLIEPLLTLLPKRFSFFVSSIDSDLLTFTGRVAAKAAAEAHGRAEARNAQSVHEAIGAVAQGQGRRRRRQCGRNIDGGRICLSMEA